MTSSRVFLALQTMIIQRNDSILWSSHQKCPLKFVAYVGLKVTMCIVYALSLVMLLKMGYSIFRMLNIKIS